MRPEHARILPVLLAAAAFVAPAPVSFSARSAGPPYGPFLPTVASHGPDINHRTIPESDRVEREIQRTDRLLASAEGRVRRSASPKAMADLQSSRDRQAEAKGARAQSFYARANRLTLEARAYLKSALIQAGPPENDPEVVGRALGETDRALERGRDILEGASSSRHRRTLGSLERRQERARRLYKNGAMRGAYAETREVRGGVLALLRQSANLPVSKETASEALRRAERVVDQARKDSGMKASSRALRLEQEAREQLGRARLSFERNAYRDVLLHSKLVERHIQRAMEARRLATTQRE